MQTCPQCGLGLPDHATFCTTCGWRSVPSDTAEVHDPGVVPEPAPHAATAPDEPAAAGSPPAETAPPSHDAGRALWAAGAALPAGRGFAVSSGARRVALIVVWLVGGLAVAVGALGTVHGQGYAVLVQFAASPAVDFLSATRLGSVLLVGWLTALTAVAIPRGPSRLRRWPTYLVLAVIGLVASVVVVWLSVEVLASEVPAQVYGPRSAAADLARGWLYCAAAAAGITAAACAVLIAAAVRQYGVAAERAEPASEGSGFSPRAAVVGTCAAAGASASLVASWILSDGRNVFSLLFHHSESVVMWVVLLPLVLAGCLVPAIVFGLTARRHPRAFWIAAGAAGALLVTRNLSWALMYTSFYRTAAKPLSGAIVYQEGLVSAIRTQAVLGLVAACVVLVFGIALLAAAVAQYRAWRAGVPRDGRTPWRAVAAAAAALAIITVALHFVPVHYSVDFSIRLGGQPPAASSTSPPQGLTVVPAPSPDDGLPAVVSAVPAPDGQSGWTGDEVQVALRPKDGEAVELAGAELWVDGEPQGSDYGTMVSSGATTVYLQLREPVRGSGHTFRVRLEMTSGNALECLWKW